jgi:uncharacterized protein with HEPN domain
MRSDRDRLSDMIEAIRLISEKLPRTKDEFAGSDLLQIWVLYHIQIIGEAANGISSTFRSSHPSVPWQDIIAMRHLLIHQYFGIDLDEVWNTAKTDLPHLELEIKKILGDSPSRPDT